MRCKPLRMRWANSCSKDVFKHEFSSICFISLIKTNQTLQSCKTQGKIKDKNFLGICQGLHSHLAGAGITAGREKSPQILF